MHATAQIHLADSASFKVTVQANHELTASMIAVYDGETYQITATGEWQDADYTPSDADGFEGMNAPMFFGMLLKPLPGASYMKLCGKVEGWKFPIGNSTMVKMKRSGKLYLFPNDAKGYFGNNSGTMEVTIQRVP